MVKALPTVQMSRPSNAPSVRIASTGVNRRAKLTPDRRPILTPRALVDHGLIRQSGQGVEAGQAMIGVSRCS